MRVTPRVAAKGIRASARHRSALLGIATCLLFSNGEVRAVATSVAASGLSAPLDIANARDGSGRLFIVEQGGRIRAVRPFAGQAATAFLDVSDRVASGGERGLLGLAFHPQFASNRRLYVDYTRAGDGATVIAEYRANGAGDAADRDSERVLLVIPQPFENHNGGALRFGPDGLLYIGMGDGGSGNDPGNRAQDRTLLLGKILRIDVDGALPYAIPAGNPFAGGKAGRPEIWAYGLRNPWRFAFDRATGDFYIGDVGQDNYEEVDYFAAGSGSGANLGWRVMEGMHCTNLGGGPQCFDASYTLPVVEYTHAVGCSITGGTVYRGSSVPALAGRYVYADFCNGRIFSAARGVAGAWSTRDVLAYGSSISGFGEDEGGELYFADYARGEIRSFVAEPGDRVDVIEFYNAALDHYFITAAPGDINALDSGTLKGWQRTGQSFGAYASAAGAAGQPGAPFFDACRFYLPPALGDSHFLSASPQECADVRSRFPGYVEERPTFISAALPDPVSGACANAQVPVYRIWNQRADSNHRYTTDIATRDAMAARGGVVEGYGNDPVAMCAPE